MQIPLGILQGEVVQLHTESRVPVTGCMVENCKVLPANVLLGIVEGDLSIQSVITKRYTELHPVYRSTTSDVLSPNPQQAKRYSPDLEGYIGNGLHPLTTAALYYLDISVCSQDDRVPVKFTDSAIFEQLPLRNRITSLCTRNQLPWLRRAVLEQALFAKSFRRYRIDRMKLNAVLFWSGNRNLLKKITNGHSTLAVEMLCRNLILYINHSEQFYRNEFIGNNMFAETEPNITATLRPFYQVIVVSGLSLLLACYAFCGELAWKWKRITVNDRDEL